jgi:hypothetical protein
MVGEYGGGDSLVVKNSEFKNNIGVNISTSGYYMTAEISNTIFSSNDNSPMISSNTIYSSMTVSNCIFINQNDADSYIGKGILFTNGHLTTDRRLILNSLFINSSVEYYQSGKNTIYNSIFIEETENIIVGTSSLIVDIGNSYIDLEKVALDSIMLGNIFDMVNLGFVDSDAENYRLTSSSDLIDAGTSDVTGVYFPTIDMDANARISGGNIDIGPYEFSSTSPIINSVTFTGTAQEQKELTFTVDYTLAENRVISDVQYDFLNDGNYTSLNIYTFNAAGTYTVGVKVIDSEGEFSTTTTSVTIAELPFSEMTYEQKLIKAISPEYYDDLLADIALDNANATEAAKQYVQDNLTEFDLVTLADKNTAVSAATSAGITTGKQYVLENPTEFKLMGLTALKSDQNGDGKADILWRNETTGNNWLWSMDGLIIGQSKGIGSVNLDWDIAGRGDFNGDGKSDILWRNRETGLNYIWIMDGITATVRKPLNTVNGAEWQIKSVADFDGDGKADIFWHNQTSGLTYIYIMDGAAISSRGALNTVNPQWQVIGK